MSSVHKSRDTLATALYMMLQLCGMGTLMISQQSFLCDLSGALAVERDVKPQL